MERTAEEEHEEGRRRAIERLALAVRAMAEERHLAQQHGGPFHRCTDATCANTNKAYLAL
jgi:hypothetical protein